jgi:hypothetical protein
MVRLVNLVTHSNLHRTQLVKHLENCRHLSATAMVMAHQRVSPANLLCRVEQSQRLRYGMRYDGLEAMIAGKQQLIPHRMGELEPWIDENFVRSVWFGMGEQVNVKMIRDKFSGYVTLEAAWFLGRRPRNAVFF